MLYRIVDDISDWDGICPSSEYPYDSEKNFAVCVLSDLPPDVMRNVIVHIGFAYDGVQEDPFELYDMEVSDLAEILRDFFGAKILNCDPAGISEGMTLSPYVLRDSCRGATSFVIRCMRLFEKPGLRERLAEIYQSAKQGS